MKTKLKFTQVSFTGEDWAELEQQIEDLEQYRFMTQTLLNNFKKNNIELDEESVSALTLKKDAKVKVIDDPMSNIVRIMAR